MRFTPPYMKVLQTLGLMTTGLSTSQVGLFESKGHGPIILSFLTIADVSAQLF